MLMCLCAFSEGDVKNSQSHLLKAIARSDLYEHRLREWVKQREAATKTTAKKEDE